MYLVDGVKDWILIDERDMSYLAEQGLSEDRLAELNFAQLVHVADGYLWGRIYYGRITENNFLYFPSQWAHRVITWTDSFGITGYL